MNLVRVFNRNILFTRCLLSVKINQCSSSQRRTCNGVLALVSRRNSTLLKNVLSLSRNFQVRDFRLSMVLGEEKEVSTPEFPESITEGDIKQVKKVGESVKVDDILCEIETDKTSIPVPSPYNGVITEVFAEEGGTVKAKQKLFKIKIGPGAPPEKRQPEVSSKPPPKAKPSQPTTPGSVKPQASEPPRKESPSQKIPPRQERPPSMPTSLSAAYIKLPPQSPTSEITGTRSEHRVKMSRMRQRIAQRLKDAQNTCAMLTTFNEVDMTNIMAFRKANQDAFTKKHGIKLGFMSAFLKACVYALQDQPVVNAVIIDNEVIYRDYIDISVAVASPKGLLVPVIRNVEKMNYAEIEKAINVMGKKAREGKIAVEDMDGGTFTVSNGGVFGSLMGTPIINPPQSAILGMHGVFERPVAVNHQVAIRPMMYIALTYDHRLIDGREAVLFLRKIKAGVENPTIILSGI